MELDKVTTIPTSGFEADKDIKEQIIVDAKNMMMGHIGYAKIAKVNLALYKWLKRTPTGGMRLTNTAFPEKYLSLNVKTVNITSSNLPTLWTKRAKRV